MFFIEFTLFLQGFFPLPLKIQPAAPLREPPVAGYGKWEIKGLSRDSFCISCRYRKGRDRYGLRGVQP